MNTEIIDAGRDMSGGYKVDVSRGTNVDRVSSEWFSRPDDERYLSLDDLFSSVKGRAERSRTRTVESAAIRVGAHRDNPEKLGLVLPGADASIAPTHWSFGQLSSVVGAPAAYLRQLPAPLAGINRQYGLTNPGASRSRPWKSRMAARNCAPSPGPTMAASTTMNWSAPSSGSRHRPRRHALESAGRAGLVDGALQRVAVTGEVTTLPDRRLPRLLEPAVRVRRQFSPGEPTAPIGQGCGRPSILPVAGVSGRAAPGFGVRRWTAAAAGPYAGWGRLPGT